MVERKSARGDIRQTRGSPRFSVTNALTRWPDRGNVHSPASIAQVNKSLPSAVLSYTVVPVPSSSFSLSSLLHLSSWYFESITSVIHWNKFIGI